MTRSAEILCRRCLFDEALPESEMIKSIDQYVSSLPEAVRASEKTYEARLAVCAACEHLASLTCRLCGCFVQARCAKKQMQCPLPQIPKWIQETEESDTI